MKITNNTYIFKYFPGVLKPGCVLVLSWLDNALIALYFFRYAVLQCDYFLLASNPRKQTRGTAAHYVCLLEKKTKQMKKVTTWQTFVVKYIIRSFCHLFSFCMYWATSILDFKAYQSLSIYLFIWNSFKKNSYMKLLK